MIALQQDGVGPGTPSTEEPSYGCQDNKCTYILAGNFTYGKHPTDEHLPEIKRRTIQITQYSNVFNTNTIHDPSVGLADL